MYSSKKQLHILHIIEATSAGVGRHVIGLCQGLVNEGHKVTIIYSPLRIDDRFLTFKKNWGHEICFISLDIPRAILPFTDGKVFFEILSRVNKGNYDLIHGHSSKGGALARLVGFCTRIPTIYTPNGLITSAPQLPWIKKLLYSLIEKCLGRLRATYTIAVCKDEADFLISNNYISKEKVTIIENALSEEEIYDFKGIATKRSFDKNALTLGAMMRFSYQKDPLNLIKAFHYYLTNNTTPLSVKLIIAGDGDLYNIAQDYITRENITSISLLGWQNDIDQTLASMDIFILSSRYEGFSYVILEAMAAGLPVIATNVFGVNDTLSLVAGNQVVPIENDKELANALTHLLSQHIQNTQILANISKQNQQLIEKNFEQSLHTKKTLTLYRNILNL